MHDRIADRLSLLPERQQAKTILPGIPGQRLADHGGHRGKHIGQTAQPTADGAWLDLPRPTHHKGNAMAPFVDVRLLSTIVKVSPVLVLLDVLR